MHSPGASGPTDNASPRSRDSRAPRLRFRADIEGIRAFALMLALLCHGGVPLFAGGFIGVDMFFVLSGFLITGLLVVEAEKSGTISLRRFYAQRAKRLLPLATLVLVVTMIAGSILLPASDGDILGGDILGAALHVANWRFAAQSVDYFGPESAASPVMHYWSLSIEEQFYLVWALIVLAVVWLWNRRGNRSVSLRTALLPVVGAAFLFSFIYSLGYSAESPNEAYFSTMTRAWQIAAGALLALVPLPKLSPRWCLAVSLGALAMIVYAVLTLSPQTLYPGWAGLLPVIATGALVVAGAGAVRSFPQRMLELRPVVYVGGLSYAWYLWHYPVMILGLAWFGSLGYLGMTALVYIAVIPAAITHHLVGQPLRYSKSLSRIPRRAITVGAACMVASVTTVLAVGAAAQKPPKANWEVTGASTLKTPHLQAKAKAIRPRPTASDARGDRGAVWDRGCMIEPMATKSGDCVFGNPRARKTVVLFGDSHAMAMFGAANGVAEQRNWRLVTLVKAGCPPYETTVYNNKVGREYRECGQWHENALDRISDEQPDLILTAGSIWVRAMSDGKVLADEENTAALESGYVQMLERLRDLSPKSDIVAIKDLPMAPHDMTDCVSEHMDDLAACAWQKGPEYDDSLDLRAARAVRGVKSVDLSPAICSPRGRCFGVIGDALVYRDNDHMTATFSATLAPWLNRALKRIGI